jgi:hypothetical protein
MKTWKDIPQFEGIYQASTTGQIRRTKSKRELKGTKNKDGYLQLALYKKGSTRKKHYVHRLIAMTFLGDYSLLSVHHINGIRDDNRIENLMWMNIEDNKKLRKFETLRDKIVYIYNTKKFKSAKALYEAIMKL